MWRNISRAAGLVILAIVLIMVIWGRTKEDVITIQSLLGIAAALLGIPSLFKKNGGDRG